MPAACAQKGHKKCWGMERSRFLPSHTRSAHMGSLSWDWDEGICDNTRAGHAGTTQNALCALARGAGRGALEEARGVAEQRVWKCPTE